MQYCYVLCHVLFLFYFFKVLNGTLFGILVAVLWRNFPDPYFLPFDDDKQKIYLVLENIVLFDLLKFFI